MGVIRVVVPFALALNKGQAWALQAVQLALAQDGVGAGFHHMTSDDSYYELLSGLWAKGEGFIVVEHDIVPWPGAIQELANCPRDWCTLPYYSSMGWIVDGLGCTKFGADLIAAHPSFLKEPFPACCQHTRYYCGLDRLIAHRMQDLGIKPHVHAPGVVNLNSRWT